jgi:hypothetical protein
LLVGSSYDTRQWRFLVRTHDSFPYRGRQRESVYVLHTGHCVGLAHFGQNHRPHLEHWRDPTQLGSKLLPQSPHVTLAMGASNRGRLLTVPEVVRSYHLEIGFVWFRPAEATPAR